MKKKDKATKRALDTVSIQIKTTTPGSRRRAEAFTGRPGMSAKTVDIQGACDQCRASVDAWRLVGGDAGWTFDDMRALVEDVLVDLKISDSSASSTTTETERRATDAPKTEHRATDASTTETEHRAADASETETERRADPFAVPSQQSAEQALLDASHRSNPDARAADVLLPTDTAYLHHPIEQLCGQMSRVQQGTDTCFIACPDNERSTDLLQCPSCGQVWLLVSCNKVYCDCDTVKGCVGCDGEGRSERAATPLRGSQVSELRAHRGLRDLVVDDYFR